MIKTNANQKYTSTSQTTFFLRQIAKRAGIPTQEFEVRNDSVRLSLRERRINAPDLRLDDRPASVDACADGRYRSRAIVDAFHSGDERLSGRRELYQVVQDVL